MSLANIPAGIAVSPVPRPRPKVQPARKQIFVPPPAKVQMTRASATGVLPDQELLHSLYEAILVADRDGRVLDSNARAEVLFGLSGLELRLRRLSQLIAKMDESVLAGLRRAADERRYTVIEADCQGPSGRIFQAEIAASGIKWRDTPGLCLSIRDITRRKEMEAMLIMVNNAMYNTVDGIVITNMDGVVQFANPSFAELVGQESRAEVVGRNIRSFITDVAVFDEMLGLVRDRNRCSQELMLQSRTGSVPVLASGAPTMEPPDRLTGMVFSFGDISERLRLEAADRQSREKELEARELQNRINLLSNLEYGLNNPLQALLSMVELEPNSDYQEHVQRVVEVIREFHETMISNQPVVKKTAATLPPAAAKRDAPARSVLVVDDEDVIRSLFVRILQTNFPEMKVASASNGAEAVLRFQESRVDIIVLDLAMPGMNGEQAYRAIENLCKERQWVLPRFVFCTGFLPPDGIRQVVADDSATRLLMKPVKVAEFVETLRELIKAAQPAA